MTYAILLAYPSNAAILIAASVGACAGFLLASVFAAADKGGSVKRILLLSVLAISGCVSSEYRRELDRTQGWHEGWRSCQDAQILRRIEAKP